MAGRWVRSRFVWCSGRRVLRERLDRRGAGLGAGLLLFLLDPGRAKAVSGPLVGSTVRVMALGASGRRKQLESKFAGAARMAEASLGLAVAAKIYWLWAVVTVVAIVLGLSGSAALAIQGKLAPDADPATLPRNLTNILNVDCG